MKIFLTILSIFIFQLSFAQMRVEDLKSDSDVVKFINYNFADIKEKYLVSFCLASTSFWEYDGKSGPYFDSIAQNTKWFTMDINRDGKLDLVFCGCVQNESSVILFLSEDEKKYVRFYISTDYCSYRPYFAYKYNNDTLIFGGIKNVGEELANKSSVILQDTIVYSYGSLTEINSRNTHEKIESIKVSLMVPLSSQRARYLEIGKNGTIKLEEHVRENGKWWIKKYVFANSSSKGKAILAMVENLPFYKYDSSYDCNVMDGAVWNTDIFFANHKKITIWDLMGIGPFGLRSIYHFVGDLFDNKNRKLLSVVRDPIPIP